MRRSGSVRAALSRWLLTHAEEAIRSGEPVAVDMETFRAVKLAARDMTGNLPGEGVLMFHASAPVQIVESPDGHRWPGLESETMRAAVERLVGVT